MNGERSKEASASTTPSAPTTPASESSDRAAGWGVERRDDNPESAAARSSTTEEVMEDLNRLDFSVHVSMRYHAKRRAWLDMVHRLAMVTAAVGGSAAFASISGGQGAIAAWSSFLVAVAGALNVAFSPSERARKEDGLYQRFCELASDMAMRDAPTPEDVRSWAMRKFKIEAEEATALDALNVICHNIEAEARGYGQDQIYEVSWIQKYFAHIITFPGSEFKPKGAQSI